jgi:acyl carrier protein
MKRSNVRNKPYGGRGEQEQALSKVRRALLDVLPGKTTRQLRREALLIGDLGVDSLKAAELSLSLERHFGRPVFVGEIFADVDDPRTLTVGDVAEMLARAS